VRAFVVAALTLAAAAPAAEAAPNDPLFDASPLPNATNEQWDLASPASGFDRGISADRAWPVSTGRGVVIADIDVGVQLDHPDLADKWALYPGEMGTDARGRDRRFNGVDDDRNGFVDDWRGFDFFGYDPIPTTETRNNHGTNVAGVLGAATNNGRGIAGVAPDARLLPVRTADNILHQSSRLAEGIVFAADRGARVMSMSLGTDSAGSSLRRAAAYAERRGAVLVAAMGNEFHFHHEFPATLDEVIGVGGLNPDTANAAALQDPLAVAATDFTVHAAYSDFGPKIDVVAPTQVPTTELGGGYKLTWSGTSAATPHVAGVAALILSRGRQLGLDLNARETRQIIRQTADDLTAGSHGYKPGWDRLSGYGRVNAERAVKSVGPGRIPPDTDIDKPGWYAPKNRPFAVVGRVKGRSATRWVLELGRGEEPESWLRIASGRGTGRRAKRLARIDARRLPRGGWTLRLRSQDSNGNTGEDRGFFFALRDPSLKKRLPRDIRSSGEASPALGDLNRDRVPEIVLASSDGAVRVLNGRTRRHIHGWPQRMRWGGARAIRRRIGRLRKGFEASPAVGNIAGGRRPEVVAAGLDGRVYAWHANGRRVRGFPVQIDLRQPGPDGKLDAAIYASPALADLNGDRKLDVVVGAADQKIYAWNGRGVRLPGWPVLARDPQGDVAKVLSSPAVGDLNGDGSPDVVEGTAEAYGSTPSTTGRVYAFSATGKLLPGWPVKPEAIAADSIPLAGEGVPDSPSLADVDGDGRDEVAVSAFTGQPELYRGDGTRLSGGAEGNHFQTLGKGSSSPAAAPSALALGANGAFGRTEPGGPLRFFAGLVDSRLAQAQLSPASPPNFQHLIGGWDARSGGWLSSFPIPVEGWTILASPVVADVDGDGRSEVVAGSSGYLVHAFRQDGSEPPGWPKQTGGWLLASPAVGDVDGDGKLEVVAVTREGYLFVWNVPGRASPPPQWSSFRHDSRNTGRYGR
jgi:subtilisin family serine protease